MEEKELLSAIKSMLEEQNVEIVGHLSAIDAKLAANTKEISELRAEVKQGFISTRSELVEAVETVGHKVDTLERTIKDVQNVTAQNAYDVQLMRRQA